MTDEPGLPGRTGIASILWHTSLHNPDWAAYAEQCGATGIGPVLLHIEQDAALV